MPWHKSLYFGEAIPFVLFRLSVIPLISFLIAALPACQRDVTGNAPPDTTTTKTGFDSIPLVLPVQPMIQEASGIADSKVNAGYLWVEEDSGNPNQLYLLKHDATARKKVYLAGITNRDWEDMTLSGSDIYVGEIGDNNVVYSDYAFYKFPEPAMATDTVRNIETIRFKYPDGSHDAEAFFVEPSTKNIYVITKRDSVSKIYKLAAPLSTSSMNTATLVGQLPYNGVTSAALSADEKEIIVKTYLALYYYPVNAGEKKEEALQKSYTKLPYVLEPQGEAVCFAAANSGYYTLSEQGLAASQQLYFYKRK